MLKSLKLKDFTVFQNADLQFAQGLNIIVGENGAGKTHILKAAYSGIAANVSQSNGTRPSKVQLEPGLANKFVNVFRPDSLGRLVRRAVGRKKCDLTYGFLDPQLDFRMSFSRLAKTEVSLTRVPKGSVPKRPVYLPARELLTIHPGFVSLYETTHLSFEETWRDRCTQLGAPLVRGARETSIRLLLNPLEEAMDGKLELYRSGRFYLSTKTSGRLEMHLVAEGLRKLATLARLIATGSLLDTGYLFWDEPEANLNPRIIKLIARSILEIAGNGIQVFIASHSLFLLRELQILHSGANFAGIETRCFGLHVQKDGSVKVEQGSTVDEIGDIAALDEELQQSERYLESEMQVSGDSKEP